MAEMIQAPRTVLPVANTTALVRARMYDPAEDGVMRLRERNAFFSSARIFATMSMIVSNRISIAGFEAGAAAAGFCSVKNFVVSFVAWAFCAAT